MEKRVVITASAAITPIGHHKDEIIDSLVNEKSGVKELRDDNLLTDHIASKVFGTVSYPSNLILSVNIAKPWARLHTMPARCKRGP